MAQQNYGGFGTAGSSTAQLNSLYRRINELEQLLYSRQNTMNNVNKSIQSQYRDETKAMAESFRRSYKDYADSLCKNFNDSAESLNRQYRSNITALCGQYEKLRRETADIEFSLREKQKELENELRKLRNKTGSYDRQYKERAIEAINSLCSNISNVERNFPVECFFPRKINIYQNALRRSKSLFEEGLYDIAVSCADSAGMGVERLKNDTERETERLLNLVDRYEALLEIAEQYVSSDVIHRFTLLRDGAESTVTLEDDDIDYWSDGTFSILLDEMSVHRENINHIRQSAVKTWLTGRKEAETTEFFREQIENIKIIPEILRITAEYAFRAYSNFMSLNRYCYMACQEMKRQNFRLVTVSFGACRTPQTKGYWKYYNKFLMKEKSVDGISMPDYREERRLVFRREHSGADVADVFIVHIMPERSGTDIVINTLCEIKSAYHNELPLAEMLTEIFSTGTFRPQTVNYGYECYPDPHRVFTRTEAENLAVKRVFS